MGEITNRETSVTSLQTRITCQDRSNTRFLGKLRALCSAFLQVKQTNKINLELKETKWGLRSIKKARTCIFTHLFEQSQNSKTKKSNQYGTRKVSLLNYLKFYQI